jgi:hypothetical protein
VNRARMAKSPALESYVETYLSKEGLATAAEVGYVGLSKEETASTLAAFEAARAGSGA